MYPDWKFEPAGVVYFSEVSTTNRFGRYFAPQSPTMLQSGGTGATTNLGIGSCALATVTVEIGAKEILAAVVIAPPEKGARPRKVGNCALSCIDGFASTTS